MEKKALKNELDLKVSENQQLTAICNELMTDLEKSKA